MLTVASLVCNAATWTLLVWKIPYTQDTVFLHYNVFFGVDLTGSWSQLLWLPGSGLGILFVNSLAVFFGKHMDHVAKTAITILTLLFQVMLLVASLLVILLNTA